MSTTSFDLIVIGSGPAGYVAAIHGAQNGLKTALIEKEATLGGTCLNVGCIPAKAMLFSATQFDKAKKLASYGVKIKGAEEEGGIALDFAQIMKRKNDIVSKVVGGVNFLMKKNKIEVIRGHGRLAGKGFVEVEANGTKTKYAAKNIVLATGSRVRSLPHIKIDGVDIWSSDHILSAPSQPKSLAVLGGGVIGCEFASCFGRYGTKVTIFEMADQVLPTEDTDSAKELLKAFRKQGIEAKTGVKVSSVVAKGGKVEVTVEGEAQPHVFEKALISIGRSPNTEDIGLNTVGITPDRGTIPVDLKTYQTSVPGVYAVGDIINTPMLAHTASAEAIFAVDTILGKKRIPFNYLTNPNAVYTYPEVASVGLTEQALIKDGKKKDVDYQIGNFPFSAIAKAKIDDTEEGFVKIITDKKYGEILGAHIVHAKASDLIAELGLGKNLEMTIDELITTIHPHPTISEAVYEAAHAATGHPLHI